MKDFDYTNYLKDLGKSESKQFEKTLRNGLHSFHEDFDELLEETKLKKIIVFIDDLDRCMPDTIIGTLEAIKLFLFSKKTIFVIGADERLIKYAVRKRFPEVQAWRSDAQLLSHRTCPSDEHTFGFRLFVP